MIKKITLLTFLSLSTLLHAQDDTFAVINRGNRRFNAKNVRVTASNERVAQTIASQPTNGDEDRYTDKRASYGKALKQNTDCLIDPNAFAQLVVALENGSSNAFLNISMGTDPVERRLVDPQAALAFNLDGADSWIHTTPAPPTLTSAEAAGEMVELYWHALLRDIPFNKYATDPFVADAIADLNTLSNFKGPKINGSVTDVTLFRGNSPKDVVGPFVSQFLYLPVPYGPAENFSSGFMSTPGIDFQAQVVPVPGVGNNFMTTVNDWKDIQKGENPATSIMYTTTRHFIRNERDLCDYVHQDSPPVPYLNAAFILLSFGETALDRNNPFIGNPTQESFVTYNNPDLCYLIGLAAETALRAAWYQKWMVHRKLRPEFFGFLVHQQKTDAQYFDIHDVVINSDALDNAAGIFATYGTYLLPMAYPEGSPTHPSYPAGHATVAGACATILKAFFNEDFIIPNPIQPNNANTMLEAYAGTPLTAGGEINKLAANIALARDMAGVHYRSDGIEGILLGEKVAIALLQDEAYSRNINFAGFNLTKFDGTKIIIGGKKRANNL